MSDSTKKKHPVTVMNWMQEGNKIYLIARNGKKYRYAGNRTMEQLEKEYPRGASICISWATRREPTVIIDDMISL